MSEVDVGRRPEDADAAKAQFLNMAAHELQTPLTPLRLQMHLLLSGDLGPIPERALHAIKVANRSVERLTNLASEMLNVARLQGGGLRFKVQSFPAAEAVAEVVDGLAETARLIQVDLQSQVERATLTADRGRFTEILGHLVGNALKFTPRGGRVRILGRTEGDSFVVDVEDTGIGFTEEQRAQFFKPFSQMHNTMSVSSPGAGLGLHISQSLARAMGGEISCRSPGVGKGATFTFRQPLKATLAPGSVVPALGAAMADRIRELI